MMPSKKISCLLMIVMMAFVMAACSGLKATSSGSGTGGGTGKFTIGGTITNLVGSGLVLTDNGTDTLTITGTGTVTFKFTNSVSDAYDVEIQTQPTNPGQTCTLAANKGTATANVTTVAIACTTNPVTATIGGTLSGLAPNDTVILENNSGDALTLTANGPFTFKTPVTGPTDAYAVTVNNQPNKPTPEICTVTNGSGTATANVTNVAVNCVLSYTIGGTITGLTGTGMVIEDTVTMTGQSTPLFTDTYNVPNGASTFTVADYVPTGATYTVSITTQPSVAVPGQTQGITQTCTVVPSTATGTATANVNSVQINCPAVTFSISGNVVGLAGLPPSNGAITDGTFVIENELGNTITVPQNEPFTFSTAEALNTNFQVSVKHAASSQFQLCTLWNNHGVVQSNVSNVVVDCGHNDWTWIDGTNKAGNIPPGTPQYGLFPQSPVTTIPNPYTNTPGARYGASGWVDKYGNLWLFGGDGWEQTGKNPPDTLDAPMNDMWVCVMWERPDYCEWQLVGAYSTSNLPNGFSAYLNAQNEDQPGFYTHNAGQGLPLSRLGAASWTDANGNFWMFGGADASPRYMNDLWMFDTSTFDGTLNSVNGGYQTQIGAWTWVSGSSLLDQPGVYTGTLAPGARTNAVTWTDKNGIFWMFGGFGYDGQSPATLGFLNDLWKYDPVAKTWTWVSGGNTNKANQSGNYGTQGTPAASNIPGGRQEAVGWYDSVNGNLWLFGGEGMDDGTQSKTNGTLDVPSGYLNDLWVYNTVSGQWTFVFGSTIGSYVQTNTQQFGVYGSVPSVGPPNTTAAAGTVGLIAASNTTFPGARYGSAGWIDKSGDLWLFGGWGSNASQANGNGSFNDLWVYVPKSPDYTQPGTWTWVKGSNTGSVNGVYGSLLRPYATYELFTPGGRSNATYWIQNVGNALPPVGPYPSFQQFWMFGGEGYDATSSTNGYLNDMWRYLPYQDY
jgi:hypothetical protein